MHSFFLFFFIYLIGDYMYLYTGGKTGGHIMPLIRLIKQSDAEAIYVGQKGNLEEKLCKSNDILFLGIEHNKNKILMGLKGYRYLLGELKNKRIDAIISTGGYVSLACILFGIKNKIPLFLIEENVVLGAVNKFFYPFCKKVFLAFELEKNKNKMLLTGLPIREYIKRPVYNKYDILVIGGSLGSKPLCLIADELSKKYKVCLVAGRYYKDFKNNSNLDVLEYTEDIYSYMAGSKIIIARAGASTAQEIFMMNKPFICIPSMKTKGNHQYHNAKFFSEKKACFLVLENQAAADIDRLINNILLNPQISINMSDSQNKLYKSNAAKKILTEIEETINGI